LPLNGETISFAGTLGKRVTAETKTDLTVNESERDGKDRERGKENERARGAGKKVTGPGKGTTRRDGNETRSPPKASDGRARRRRLKTVAREGGREGAREGDRNGGGRHSIQFPKKLFSV